MDDLDWENYCLEYFLELPEKQVHRGSLHFCLYNCLSFLICTDDRAADLLAEEALLRSRRDGVAFDEVVAEAIFDVADALGIALPEIVDLTDAQLHAEAARNKVLRHLWEKQQGGHA